MDKYQVKINPKSISELDYIYNYIAIEKSASENARAQINRIKNAILGLDTFPESHQVRTEGRYAGKYRQLLIDNYIVIFELMSYIRLFTWLQSNTRDVIYKEIDD